MVYRLYESAGYLGPFPAFADSADFDTLRLWAVSHNEWKGPQMAAVIVADDDRVWYVSRSGKAREVSYERGRTGGPSQAEKLIARLEGRLTGPHPAYELAPPERRQHKTIHVGHTGPNDCAASPTSLRAETPTTRRQSRGNVAATSDDEQPTAAAGVDETGRVAGSPQTVAAEQHSEAPTTIVPDVGPTAASELAWSSEAETEEITDDRSHRWGGRLLWIPLVALLCAAAAVVVWFSVTLYRQHERPVNAAPSSQAPAAARPANTAPPPIAPIVPPSQAVTPPPSPELPPVAVPPPPSPQTAAPNITAEQANTICGWLRDASWTMPQIESSTGDMLANDNPSFKGTPDIFRAISAAMSGTCPEVANQRPF